MTIRKKPLVVAMSAILAATAAYAATQLQTQIQLKDEITLSEGGNGHKPKIQRASDGTLVVAFGDSPADAGVVYDVKDDAERKARDIFVKWCKPDATRTCDNEADWTKATTAFGAEGNVSASATRS
ncbi:MAG TPA: hypothetical protein ENO16_05620, partial [Chromatiales bacterium]|nr:hypothetical protein [Chromatiales bacterium]